MPFSPASRFVKIACAALPAAARARAEKRPRGGAASAFFIQLIQPARPAKAVGFAGMAFLFSAAFFFSAPPAAADGIFEDITCMRELKAYYPKIFDGTAERRQRQRFFLCLHDAVELIVKKNIFYHADSRDHFTREEIYRLFHLYLKFPPAEAERFVSRLFVAKKILVGGKIDQLADRELELIYNLAYDYEKAYHAFQKEIPLFRSLFFGRGRSRIPPERLDRFLGRLKAALSILGKAYQRENAAYDIRGLDQMPAHLLKAGLISGNEAGAWGRYTRFFHLWVHGLFTPRTEIAGGGWAVFFRSFGLILSQFAYYKNYIQGESLFHPSILPMTLRSLRFFAASLAVPEEPEREFPLKNLDEMLFLMASASLSGRPPSDTEGGLFDFIGKHEGGPLSLLTRTLACFSIPPSTPPLKKENLCEARYGGDSPGTVTLAFPDGQYTLYEDRQEWAPDPKKSFGLRQEQLAFLDRWLAGYIQGADDIHSGRLAEAARRRLFDQWLDPFFGETGDGRISFGSFAAPFDMRRERTAFRLLGYQSLLSLFLPSYIGWPGQPAPQGEAGMSFKGWRRAVNEISPVLAAMQKGGYLPGWRHQFNSLFEYADYFLNSSDRNGLLSGRELIDLAAHFMAAMDSSSRAFPGAAAACGEPLEAACAAESLFLDESALSAFPLLQSHLPVYGPERHQAAAAKLFEAEGAVKDPSGLIAFFLLLQMLEMNFYFFDEDQSRLWEDNEIQLFIRGFEEKTAAAVPHIATSSQARSFLMHSFKTGLIPFLSEGDEAFLSIHFLNWHLRPEKRESFAAGREKVYSLGMDFYILYRKARQLSPLFD